ncbi:MAG: TraB/GumN family protein [Octadecabacter sp.]
MQPALALCSGDSLLDRLSQADRNYLGDVVADTPYERGLFWQATRGDQHITFVGTMHIYDPRLVPIRNRIQDDIANADLILLEMTQAEEAELQAELATNPARMFLTDGPSLIDLLDEQTWGMVAEAASARQIPPFLAAKFRPWYLAVTLAIPPCAMPDMVMGRRGLDHMILEDANTAGVPTQALEPWHTLFDVMEVGTLDEQIDMMRLGLLSPQINAEMFVAMLDGYFAGEVAQIWEMSGLSLQFIPDMDIAVAEEMFAMTKQSLLIDRNRNWIPVIEAAALKHDRIVVAVGAAHLPGEVGVLRLLEREGWIINAAY